MEILSFLSMEISFRILERAFKVRIMISLVMVSYHYYKIYPIKFDRKMDVIEEINALKADIAQLKDKNRQLEGDLSNGQLSDSVRDFKQKLILENQRTIANQLAVKAALIERENRSGNFTSIYTVSIVFIYSRIHSFIHSSFISIEYLFVSID